MNALEKLAVSLERRDEQPNVELAQEIIAMGDEAAIAQLAANLNSRKYQNDCVKTLYEIGYIAPDLIAAHADAFFSQLTNRNNRMQWGAMAALASISRVCPDVIAARLDEIIRATKSGSVITRDNAVNILIELCRTPSHFQNAFGLLLAQISDCPTNQLPMYAERTLVVLRPENSEGFVAILKTRLVEIPQLPKRTRVEKVIKKLAA